MIHVRPASERRRDFARWATGHTVKLRTVGPDVFAVPPHLFVDVPEELLIGAIVDGHRYRSPLEDEATGTPPPGPVDQPDVLVGELVGVPGVPLPPVPDAAYPPDAVLLPVAPAAEPGQDGSTPDSSGGNTFACDRCPRTFTTARGRDTHRRQAHTED
ncbi:hypothetical protein [Streptomyces pseudogriseolus]|nr:hypothetical protein [Streptomyces gancidicus]